MKHLLNNLSEEEKNAIREQHTGGMKVMTENFSKLLNSKLGDAKPIVEQKEEENEGIWSDIFGKPSIERAKHTSMRGTGASMTGKDDSSSTEHNHIIHKGEKFYDDDIEYADYNDLGELPRVENGKLIIANPAWES